MSTKKKYKLLKDLPNVKAGSIFTPVSALAYAHLESGKWHVEYCNEIVETNSEWFSPIPESSPLVSERIEVGLIQVSAPVSTPERKVLLIDVSHDIPEDKFPAIKSAIQDVLNGESVFNTFEIEKQIARLEGIKEGFIAGQAGRYHGYVERKYPTLQDYLSTLSTPLIVEEKAPCPVSNTEKFRWETQLGVVITSDPQKMFINGIEVTSLPKQ